MLHQRPLWGLPCSSFNGRLSTLTRMDGKWEVRDTKNVYESDSIKVQTTDVELPDKSRLTWDVVTPISEFGSAMMLASVSGKGTLMIWRYRFVTDTWTWELPSGMVEKRETAKNTARRCMLEATGWKAGDDTRSLLSFQPMNSRVEIEVRSFITAEATFEGPGRDTQSAGDIAWLTRDDLLALIDKGDVSDGPSLTLILYALSKDLIR